MVGVDVARDQGVSRVAREVARGRWLDPGDEKGVVIGARLARTLGLEPGGELLLLVNAADGSMANELYRVRGVLRSMGEAIDRGGVFMTAPAWRQLLVVPDGVHQIIVRRPPGVGLEPARATVARLAPRLDVRSWPQILPTVASIMDTQRASLVMLYVIVYAAVGIVLLNAMMMAVFERIRELGVLKAVGMKPGAVFALVAVEGAWQTLVALAAGLVVALPILWRLTTHGIDLAKLGGLHYQGIAFDSAWRAQLDGATVRGPITTLVVVVALALLFPAWKAARLQPVDAMRYR
jgi:ABC-type lipoprotein release transport system permease subunit